MTNYTGKFKSAIPQLATVTLTVTLININKNVFKEPLKTGMKRISLGSVGSRFHARRRGAATENITVCSNPNNHAETSQSYS